MTKRQLKATALLFLMHLLVTSALVAAIGWFLHGGTPEAYAGWLGGVIVAVWTSPLVVFVSWFVGSDLVGWMSSGS